MFQKRYTQKAKNIAVTILLVLLGFSQTPAYPEDCGRACLTGMITRYVDALVEHDPSKLPLVEIMKSLSDGEACVLNAATFYTGAILPGMAFGHSIFPKVSFIVSEKSVPFPRTADTL